MAGEGESSEMGSGLYTPEKVEILEQMYHGGCQNPSHSQRLEMIKNYPYLSMLESKEIKLWFENRRRHEKQKKKDIERKALKDKLAATRQLLLAENERLQEVLSQLKNENEYIQHLLQNASSTNTTVNHYESACNPPSLEVPENPTRSFLVADESHTEFLTVSKQSTIDRFPAPTMKALQCIVELVEEKSGKLTPPRNKETFLLAVIQQSTGGLNGDGRSMMNYAAANSLIMAMNSIRKLGTISCFTAAPSFSGATLCVKVSLLLKKLDSGNFKITTDGEMNGEQSVEEAKCDKEDMEIAKSTTNMGDNVDVQGLMAPVMPGSTEASVLADYICKSFGFNKGGMLLNSNGLSQGSVWKQLWYIKFQGYTVLLAGICKPGAI